MNNSIVELIPYLVYKEFYIKHYTENNRIFFHINDVYLVEERKTNSKTEYLFFDKYEKIKFTFREEDIVYLVKHNFIERTTIRI